MRSVKILFLLFLGLIIALLFLRLTALDTVATFVLEKAGASNVQVQFAKFSFSQSQIKTLTTELTLAPGKKLSITLRDFTVNYSPRKLLATGRCDQIIIDTLELYQTDSQKNAKLPFSLPSEISLVQNEIRAKLPVDEVHIKRFLLKGDWPRQLKDKDIRLDAFFENTSISGHMSLQMTDNTQIHADMQSADARHAQLTITGEQNQDLFLTSRLMLEPKALSGIISTQLEPVRNLLLMETDLAADLPKINGKLSGDFSLPLPMVNSSNILADFTLDDTSENHITLKASANPTTKKLVFSLTGTHTDQQFLQTSLNVNKKNITGDFNLQAELLRDFVLPYLHSPLPDINGKIKGKLDIPLPGSTDRSYGLTALATDLSLPGFKSTLVNIKATGKTTEKGFTFEQNSTLQATDIISDKFKTKKLYLDLAGNFSKKTNAYFLNLHEGNSLQIKKFSTGTISVNKINTRPRQPVSISITKGAWEVAATSMTIDPMLVAENKRTYNIGQLQIKLTSLTNTQNKLELAANVSSPSLVYQDTRTVPLKNISGNILLSNNIFTTNLQLSPETIPGRIKLKVKHDLNTKQGSLNLRTNQRFNLDPEETTLADLFSPWEFPFNIDRGKISLKAQGRWAPRKKFRFESFVTVTKGDGFYKKFLFKGLNIRQDLAVLPRLFSKSEGSFSLQHLIGGLDIFDINSKLNFARSAKGRKPLVKINNFQASLLEGTVSTPSILYDQNEPDSNFTVTIKELNLEEIIRLIKMNNLQVSGKINGVIPVTLRGKDISVANGELFNKPPGGEIHYTPENINSAGITGYALKAVENFHYDSLKAAARYSPTGQLDLEIGLQGVSPSLDTTRKVHLNIHAEQNLPALIQSLRFSKGLTEKLDKRVKDHYK